MLKYIFCASQCTALASSELAMRATISNVTYLWWKLSSAVASLIAPSNVSCAVFSCFRSIMNFACLAGDTKRSETQRWLRHERQTFKFLSLGLYLCIQIGQCRYCLLIIPVCIGSFAIQLREFLFLVSEIQGCRCNENMRKQVPWPSEGEQNDPQ